ncbi:MAG: hypothetical protein ABI693_25375, partial [Bryobacteraceae bacterium]
YTLINAICSGEVLRADQTMRDHIRFGVEAVVSAVHELEGTMDPQWRLKRAPRPYRPIQPPSTTTIEPLT